MVQKMIWFVVVRGFSGWFMYRKVTVVRDDRQGSGTARCRLLQPDDARKLLGSGELSNQACEGSSLWRSVLRWALQHSGGDRSAGYRVSTPGWTFPSRVVVRDARSDRVATPCGSPTSPSTARTTAGSTAAPPSTGSPAGSSGGRSPTISAPSSSSPCRWPAGSANHGQARSSTGLGAPKTRPGSSATAFAPQGCSALWARVASSADNAFVELVWSTMQRELLDRPSWVSRTELASARFEWIEAWCNSRQRHSALGYLIPVEYEDISPPRTSRHYHQVRCVRRTGPGSERGSRMEPPVSLCTLTSSSMRTSRRSRFLVQSRA